MRALRGISYALPVLAVLWMAGTSVLWASDECPARPVAVRGDSLSPLLLDGMRVMMKPASCAGAVRRNDLVIFRTGALKQPVIKIARGLPGDRFAVDADGFIVINDAVLRNSAGVAYLLPVLQRTMLRGYQEAYSGVIPADTYLLLGDGTQSVIDSVRLGLLHAKDFVMVGAYE